MMDKFEIVIDLDGRRYSENDVYEDEDFCRNSAQELKKTDSLILCVYTSEKMEPLLRRSRMSRHCDG